ncbi:MAG TPA: hypothetical protein VGJ26_19185 [Pirellulales bacterium]|jgi:hypothetical protein
MTKHDKKTDDDVELNNKFEDLGRKIDQRPEVQAAAEALREASEQFERAKGYYYQLRDDAAKEVNKLRGKNAADVVAAGLELVRKHPGPGVVAALLCGWFAGRIFRR